MKRNLFKAFLMDTFFWSLSFLIVYKIIYQGMFLRERFPEFSWNQPLGALGLGVLVALPLSWTSFSLGKAIKGLAPPRWGWALSFFYFILFFIAGIFLTGISPKEFFSPEGLGGVGRIFSALFTPNFHLLRPALFAATETIAMAFMATTLAFPPAFILAFFAARNVMKHSPFLMFVYSTVRFLLNFTRSMEPIVWAIIFSVWVGIGPFAGMLSLWLHSVSSLAKLYSEQIESVSEGPIEAMKASGAHPVQVIWYGIVPQVVLPYLAFSIYRWDINVRMATIIGFVGGGGIGTLLSQYQMQAKWNEVGLLIIIIASIVWAMDYTSSKIREAIK